MYNADELGFVEEDYVQLEVLPCDEWCHTQATDFLTQSNIGLPLNEKEALHLYLDLCQAVQNYITKKTLSHWEKEPLASVP